MKFKKLTRKLHRWIGITASIWLLFLASTGLLLQHSNNLKLDNSFIHNAAILKQYGIGEEFMIFETKGNSLIQIDKNLLINKALIHFPEKVQKAAYLSPYWIIQTQEQLIWLNDKGQIVQTFDQSEPPSDLNLIKWLTATNNPKLKQQAIKLTSKNYLTVEQFIFDIHAGITTSTLLNDIAAISLMFLSLSGFYLFFRKRKNQPSSR